MNAYNSSIKQNKEFKMLKKIITGTLLSAVALLASPNNEVQLLLAKKAIEKKVVVLTNMGLEGETKEKFGTLYDEYQGKLMKQRMSEIELIGNYAKNYNNLSDENANKIITQWITVEEAQMVLKKEYMAKFKKVMSSADVIRYFQIENRLELISELQTANFIPLAQPVSAEVIEAK